MENSPPSAPGPARRERRLGPLNPLTVAIAAVLLAAGGAFGWSLRGSAPTAQSTPAVLREALALERLDPTDVCGGGGQHLLVETALRGEGAVAARVADYLPKKSPIPGYEKVRWGALDAAGDSDFLPGAVEGHVAGFRPPGDGGFDVYAYRFLTRPSAAETLASTVAERVCTSGATVFEARGRPGMLVVRDAGDRGWVSAWWLTRADVVAVSYGGWGDPDADLANLAVVAGATAAPR
ncbi:MAG: hypothetical protein M3323_01560 [Actinomycetota bacterium]|nr:hypothetical protein [Actinomycetota bacterium]